MNVLSQDLKNSICVLAKAGYSFREIARRLHVRRDTVSKYAKAAGIIPGRGRYSKPAIEEKGPTGSVVKTSHCNNIPPPGEKASKSKSACEVHREWIEAQVESGRNGVAIYQDLVEKFGFTHKYDSVKAFVRRIKKKAPKRFDRLEFPPGEEAQVDYGQGAPCRPSSSLLHSASLGQEHHQSIHITTAYPPSIFLSKYSLKRAFWACPPSLTRLLGGAIFCFSSSERP